MKLKVCTSLNFLLLAFLLLGTKQVSGQIILDKAPDLTALFICAGIDGFNSYSAEFQYSGTPNASNEFILEMSDSNGNFASPVELVREGGQNSNNQFNFEFAIPTDTQGNGYRLRVRSTNPVKTSPESEPYAIYYLGHTQSFVISRNGDGVPPGSICSPTPVTLTVDNVPNADTYKYRWYRSGTLLQGNGTSILADTNGTYEAYIDYGDACTGRSNANSNGIIVSIGSSSQGIAINPPTNTALCTGQAENLQINKTDGSWSYQWYKDGTAIPGATSDKFLVDSGTAGFEGDYQVEISGSGICNERSAAVTMTNAGGFTVTRDNPANVVVLPSQPITLSVTTTANPASYQWYRGTNPIGADANTLDITQAGTYYCAVSTTGTCASMVNSENTIAVVPDSFEILIGYNPTDYQACINTDVVLEVVTINAITGTNSSDVTTQLVDAFSYQWKKDNANVAGATGKNISLTATSENGSYTVDATLDGTTEASNSLPVQLLTNETVTITSTGTVFCSGGDTLTISTTTDLTNATYTWERDGATTGSATPTLTVTNTGTYRLALNRNGCTLYSNEIVVTGLDPNLIQLDVDGDVVFPEGSSKTVTATGGTAYQWLDAGNNLVSSTDAMTFSEEGVFTLVASVGNCSVTRQLTAVYLDLFNIPNVITPNGDGANDQWVIPNSYSNKADVIVVIYDDKGKELVNVTSYQNNWPESSMAFPDQNMVFYYIIRNATETLKQGTITVIR